jgi:RNA polymerase sigma-70 factor (ECF subfamily)
MFKRFRKKTTALPDEEVLELYRSTDDLVHLGDLYERYVELVFGVCLKYFKDRPKAEDAVMNIFEKLVEKAKTQDIRDFRPWLHVVAKNYCLMELRKKDRTVSMEDLSPTAQQQVVQSIDPVHPLDENPQNGEEKALRECMDTLSAEQRKCIEEFYFQGKSYKDISAESGEALGMVRSRIQNGRRNLRNCMEKKKTTVNQRK